MGSALAVAEKTKPVIVPEQKEEKRKYHVRNSSELPEPTKQEKEWASRINKLLNEKASKEKKMAVHLQKFLYGEMTRKYGIVFNQEKIDTLERFGLDRHTPITTFRTIQYNENLRSIFEGMLVDYAV